MLIMIIRKKDVKMAKVIADTCVWSEVLRRKDPVPDIQEKMQKLIFDLDIIMLGPIRQELLSGLKDETRFKQLASLLSIYTDETILTEDYVQAARFCNICRSHGIQGSPVDYLICAVAYRLNAYIFTVDKDFEYYAKYISIGLYRPF